MISQHDRTHIHEILGGYGSWFTADLIRLIAHADTENKELIRQSFPDEVKAYEDWYFKRGSYEGKED